MKNNSRTVLAATFVLLFAGAFSGRALAQNHLDPDIGFEPTRQVPLSYREDDGTFLLTRGAPGNFELYIDKPGRQAVAVPIPTSIGQINSIDPASGNKAVLIGMISSSAYEVVIVDTLNPRIVDQFLAYDPTLSPDGQFITFIKMYPAHFVEGVSDHVLLYDLTRTAAGNRPAGVTIDSEINVGSPVYPPNIKTTDPNTEIPEGAITRVDTFFWAPDSSKFVFTAKHPVRPESNAPVLNEASSSKTEVDLVLANPSHEKATVAVLPAMVCAVPSCEHHLDGVEFGEEGIKAQFSGPGSNAGQKRSFEANYNQFRAAEAGEGRGTRPR